MRPGTLAATALGEPLVLAAGLALALRAFDARRFPRNALLLGLALAAAEVARAALAPFAPGISRPAVACAAAAAGLAYAFPGRGRLAAVLAAAGLAIAGLSADAGSLVARAAGLAVGAGAALALLRRLEIFHGLRAPSPLPPPRRRSGPPPLRLLFVAGEASADRWGARVLAEVQAREPGVEALGVGGSRLRAAGLREPPGAGELAIVGFTGVLAALPRLAATYRRLVALLDRERPDAVVAIDLPDWNAMLALQARARGIPTLFYVAPQVWAWRPGRVAKLAERISKLVVLFPFERAAWERAGVAVACHGHPLAEELAARRLSRAEARAKLGLDPRRPVLALAPGSRASELAQHGAPLLDAAARARAALPDLVLAVPHAAPAHEALLRARARRAGLEIHFVHDAAFELFRAADFGLVAAGSATLEAALAGLPMAVFYRGRALDAALARRLVRVDRIGLPNLLLGGAPPVFPELFQQEVTGERLAATALTALRDPARLAALRAACERVRELVPAGPTSAAVAEEVLRLARGSA
jgi:lipid-A-disaccharide synthase